jgi:hypothetical protein
VVRVTVTAGPGRTARPPHWHRTIGFAGALAAAIAIVVVVFTAGHSRTAPRNARTRAPGPAGVAAAYGYPLRCLSVAIALHDPRFARADFDHIVPCGSYTGYETAIFRRVDGAWVPVLEAISYPCPVRSLPEPVQVELGVCLPPTRAYADTPASVSRRHFPTDRVWRSTGTRPRAEAPRRPPSRAWARSLTQ